MKKKKKMSQLPGELVRQCSKLPAEEKGRETRRVKWHVLCGGLAWNFSIINAVIAKALDFDRFVKIWLNHLLK